MNIDTGHEMTYADTVKRCLWVEMLIVMHAYLVNAGLQDSAFTAFKQTTPFHCRRPKKGQSR